MKEPAEPQKAESGPQRAQPVPQRSQPAPQYARPEPASERPEPLGARLASGFSRIGWQALETVAVSAIAAGLGYLADPANPLHAGTAFPWPVLGPLLLALRYGVVQGIASVALFYVGWLAGEHAGWIPRAPDQLFFLGTLIATMIAGEFSGVWRARVRRAESISTYLDERLESLVKRYYVLSVSHDRLEQSMLGEPLSLRDALQRLRGALEAERGAGGLPAAKTFLDTLGQLRQVESAGLYAMQAGQPVSVPAATVGNAGTLDPADPMVRHCLDSGLLAHAQTDELRGAKTSRYLVVAPLVTSTRRMLGLLAIERMPFLSLNEESLQVFAVLLGYYADALAADEASREIRLVHPDCPPEFADELARLYRIRMEGAVPSAIVALVLDDVAENEGMFDALRRRQRGLDRIWEVRRAARRVLITLMPLSGAAGVNGYVLRIERWLGEQYSLDFEQAHIEVREAHLSEELAERTLSKLLTSCHV